MRTEEDRFGTITLPDECLYGIQTARCLENLSFSGFELSRYPRLITSLALVKRACAQTNAHSSVISKNIAKAIESACITLEAGEHHDQFPIDMLHGGGSIGFNVNINEVIANLANISLGEKPGSYNPVQVKQHVNACQSTADVCHTALRLALLAAGDQLLEELASLKHSLNSKKQELAPIQTIARTCLQDAMNVSLGTYFEGYEELVNRRSAELAHKLEALHRINLGGTVIGSGDGATPEYRNIVVEILSAVAGKKLTLRQSLYDAAQNMDDVAAVSAELRILAQSMIKVAMDIRLLSSGPQTGFAEIILPAVQDGSSFFVHKINPVVPETLIQGCMQVIGADRVVQAALEHGELNLNIFEGIAAKNLLEAFSMLTSSLRLFRLRCLDGITANEERCKQYASNNRFSLTMPAPAANSASN